MVAVVVAKAAGRIEFPVSWGTDFADPIDDAITWIRDHVRWLTKDVNDFIVRELWVRTTDWLKFTHRLAGARDRHGCPRPVGEGLVVGAVLRRRGVRHRTHGAVGAGDRHARPGAHGGGDRGRDRAAARRLARSPSPCRGGRVTVPRRDADDPVARLRDPVRHDLRRRDRAGRHHRLRPLRDPTWCAGQRARRTPGAGIDDRGGDHVRGLAPPGVVGGADPARLCRRSCWPSTR